MHNTEFTPLELFLSILVTFFLGWILGAISVARQEGKVK